MAEMRLISSVIFVHSQIKEWQQQKLAHFCQKGNYGKKKLWPALKLLT